MRPTEKILWIDCLGGLIVGCIVLSASSLLARLENLPTQIVIAMGIVNLVYGSFSLYITTRKYRTISLVTALAVANALWLTVCIGITVSYWQEISTFGLLAVLGEGLSVSTLGYIEWKWRDHLVRPPKDFRQEIVTKVQ